MTERPATLGATPPAEDPTPSASPATAEEVRPGRWRRAVVATRRLVARRTGTIVLAVALVMLLVGFAFGRATGPTPEADARAAIEASLLPLAVDADGIWSSSSGDRAPVSEALVAMRRDGDPALVEEHHAAWLEAYDAAIVRVAGLDLPAAARPVQRQIITSLTLSRDAVVVLGHAARVDDVQARRDLTTEVGRLRTRSEQLAQAARASTADLGGQRADVGPLPDLTEFLEGRRP